MKKKGKVIPYPTTAVILLLTITTFILEIVFVGKNYEALATKWVLCLPFIKGSGIYRLFTSLFIHSGYTHLVMNMFCLFVVGTKLEHSLGHMWLAAVYFSGGLFGNIVTLITEFAWAEVKVPGIFCGATPSVFAIIGALISLRCTQPEHFEQIKTWKMFIISILPLLPFFISYGFSITGGLGGMIFGLLTGFVIGRKKFGKTEEKEA